MNYMTFIADDDGNSSTDVTFSSIRIYESPWFDVANLTNYSAQSSSGGATVGGGGSSITLTGNTWRKYPYSYTVTTNTMLEVTIDASNAGEIIGIGMETNDDYSDTVSNIRLGGFQGAGSSFIDVANPYASGEGPVTYVIPVGIHFTGTMNYLTFIGDADSSENFNGTFSDIRIYEAY
jgi:hypothetical protein